MNELIEQLGINPKLLFSQIFNFTILLLVLKSFVYKPIIGILKERRDKIKEGMEKAEEASVRLKEIDNISLDRIKKAEAKSITIIKDTEKKAKILEQDLQKKNDERLKEMLAQVETSFKKQKEEARNLVYKDATALVKEIVVKTVQLSPESVDEELIKKAVSEIKRKDLEI